MKLYAVVSFIHAFMSVDFHGIEKTKFHVHNGPKIVSDVIHCISYFNKHLFPLLLLTMNAMNSKLVFNRY